MQVYDTYQFTIPVWAAVAMEYGDISALTDNEELALQNLEDKLWLLTETDPRTNHYTTEISDEQYFAPFNDITHEGGDVVDLTVYLFEDDDEGLFQAVG